VVVVGRGRGGLVVVVGRGGLVVGADPVEEVVAWGFVVAPFVVVFVDFEVVLVDFEVVPEAFVSVGWDGVDGLPDGGRTTIRAARPLPCPPLDAATAGEFEGEDEVEPPGLVEELPPRAAPAPFPGGVVAPGAVDVGAALVATPAMDAPTAVATRTRQTTSAEARRVVLTRRRTLGTTSWRTPGDKTGSLGTCACT
jgi:hypothetical protein